MWNRWRGRLGQPQTPWRLNIAADDSGCGVIVVFLFVAAVIATIVATVLTVGVALLVVIAASGIVVGLGFALYNFFATLGEAHKAER